MSITFSKEQAEQVRISLDNLFITEYMPLAPDNYLKVYLYGLSLASSGAGKGDELSEISKKLGLDTTLIEEAFRYWEGQELVRLADTNPLCIEYLAIKSPDKIIRKFKKEKYKSFNSQLHAMLPNRNFLPNEYNEYYNLMESYHIEAEALLTIIGYCVRLKGESITYPYILAVSKNFALDGCTTYDRVQERLNELDLTTGDLASVIKALKLKKSPDHDDRRLFIKWTKTLGFTLNIIIYVAKSIKKGGMDRLDALLTKYYEMRLFDKAGIDAYNENRDGMFALCKKINRIIGVYYEQLDYIIENYIAKWLGLGFDESALLTAAEYCFRRNIRTIEGLNDLLIQFYKEGLLTLDTITVFISETVETDSLIRTILEKAGVTRKLTSWDRDSYRTWTYSWGLPKEVIFYAAELSVGKSNPVSYMNAILQGWFNANIKTLEGAQNAALVLQKSLKNEDSLSDIPSQRTSYTSEEINAIFDRLKPEDI